MKLYIEQEEKTKEMKFSGTVKELLKVLNINPVTVIVTNKTELLTENDSVTDKDHIRILSVVSGG